MLKRPIRSSSDQPDPKIPTVSPELSESTYNADMQQESVLVSQYILQTVYSPDTYIILRHTPKNGFTRSDTGEPGIAIV